MNKPKYWVLWRYDNGSYESIQNVGITNNISIKNKWLASSSNSDNGYLHGADEFELNAEPKESDFA